MYIYDVHGEGTQSSCRFPEPTGNVGGVNSEVGNKIVELVEDELHLHVYMYISYERFLERILPTNETVMYMYAWNTGTCWCLHVLENSTGLML